MWLFVLTCQYLSLGFVAFVEKKKCFGFVIEMLMPIPIFLQTWQWPS